MIANSGFAYHPAPYTNTTITTNVYATASTTCYPIHCTGYFDWPIIKEETDPKRHIPFYRALFTQGFPPPPKPPIHDAIRAKWSPNMGQVRIDRCQPR